MKALVTGATGFLGRHVVSCLLAENVTVRALVRSTAAGFPAEVEQLPGDVGDEPSVRRAVQSVDWVLHAAARVSTTGTWAEFEAANVAGTANVLRAAVAAGVKRIVHVSSLSVYAVPRDGVTITEDCPYERGASERGFYSRSKLIADLLALQAAHSGVPVTVVRPGLLYGPGRRPPLARQAFAVGPVRIVLGSAQYLMPMSYVENVADALVRAAQVEAANGRAYTVVDTTVPHAEYARCYRRAAGQRWRAIYVPTRLLVPVAFGAELAGKVLRRTPPLTRHQLRRTTWSAYYDCARAEHELGWRPRIDLREGLRRCFAAAA